MKPQMHKIIKIVTALIVLALMIFVVAEAASNAKLSVGVTSNPFEKVISNVNKAKSKKGFLIILTKMNQFCRILEIPQPNGCPEYVSSLKSEINKSENNKKDMEYLKTVFLKKSTALSGMFVEVYGGEERKKAQKPAKPKDVLAADTDRVSENPFEPLIAWVQWWDASSYYPKTLRNHKKLGAPKVIELVNLYCKKLEIPNSIGCDSTVARLRAAAQTNKNPLRNSPRASIISDISSYLENLSEQFEQQYGTPDPNAQEPALETGGNPFAARYKIVQWWQSAPYYASAIREKHGPQMIKEMTELCEQYSLGGVAGCAADADIASAQSTLGNLPYNPSLKAWRSQMITTFLNTLQQKSLMYSLKYASPANETPSSPAQ